MPGAIRHKGGEATPPTAVLTLLNRHRIYLSNTYGTERTALRIPDANLSSIFSQFTKPSDFNRHTGVPGFPELWISIYNVKPPCCYYECTNDTVYELHMLDTFRPLIHSYALTLIFILTG
ncbi:hypothetical protein PAAG_08188 [Paracoccidioides lutzii Pb01]|uniref:Uncharacterized protein n=1 Tax=Paracoccidioides lutzii (strain ATCC MYA-826 / Pb01) TaxID=502779 RepID=C1HBP7_PARBA|nr:hypothetical protein PAAG_08188 [Paracoccidioides lutzii Pb01]EEH38461.2 hypothetical protein PAAG_08188 [Paracoccidioides lutzii Pb01]